MTQQKPLLHSLRSLALTGMKKSFSTLKSEQRKISHSVTYTCRKCSASVSVLATLSIVTTYSFLPVVSLRTPMSVDSLCECWRDAGLGVKMGSMTLGFYDNGSVTKISRGRS